MSRRVRICGRLDLPEEGQAAEFALGEKMVCIANLHGDISAMDNVCLHRGGPLGQGMVEEGKIVCPWHGWQFDLKTGAVDHNPGQKIQVYPVLVQGEDVIVELED